MEHSIKGGVILIGSLLWETRVLNPFSKKEKDLAELRQNWRNQYLDLDNQILGTMPIRYGRCSNSRNCTYTMVFSRSCLKTNKGVAAIVPFKGNKVYSIEDNFKRMAFKLAEVEGISNNSNKKLIKSWGCIALYINPKSKYVEKIKSMWDELKKSEEDYANIENANFQIDGREENRTLLNDDYTLSDDFNIGTELDFLFLTYIKPANKNNANKNYPTSRDIASEIIRSGYDTYFKQNIKSGITTFQDEDILTILES